MKTSYLVLCCAVLGGYLGYKAFFWLTGQGFYGLVLPGGALGLLAGIPPNRSRMVAIVCGLLALLLGIYAEWQFAPFARDASLGYFVTHLHHLRPATLLMILAGGGLGFWIPFRRVADSLGRESRHGG